jgi:hypothetical protein
MFLLGYNLFKILLFSPIPLRSQGVEDYKIYELKSDLIKNVFLYAPIEVFQVAF